MRRNKNLKPPSISSCTEVGMKLSVTAATIVNTVYYSYSTAAPSIYQHYSHSKNQHVGFLFKCLWLLFEGGYCSNKYGISINVCVDMVGLFWNSMTKVCCSSESDVSLVSSFMIHLERSDCTEVRRSIWSHQSSPCLIG